MSNGPVRRPPVTRPLRAETTLPVHLPGHAQAGVLRELVEQFIKYYLLQRGQIPQSIDMMRRDSQDTCQRSAHSSDSAEDRQLSISDMCTDNMSQQERKILHQSLSMENRKKAKERKQNSKFQLKRQKFMDSFTGTVNRLWSVMVGSHSGCIREVLLVLGSNAALAKEVCRLTLPVQTDRNTGNNITSRQAILTLFRSLVGCEKFQQLTTKPINLSNLTILVGVASSHVCDLSAICTQRPNHRLPPRATLITINITAPEHDVTAASDDVTMTSDDVSMVSGSDVMMESSEASSQTSSSDDGLIWWEVPSPVKGFRDFHKTESMVPI